MDKTQWYFRQRVTNPEMSQFSDFIEQADWKNVRELLGSGILTGGIVKELPVPDMQFVAVEQTIARDTFGRRVNIIDTFGDTISSIVLGLTSQVDAISVPSTVGTYLLFTSAPGIQPFTLVGQKIKLSRSQFAGNNGEFVIQQVVTTTWGGLIPSQIMVRIDEELDEEGYESGLSPRGTTVIAEILSGEDSKANAAFDELNQDIRPVNPGNERWVSLYARFDRVTFDTRLDGNGDLVDYIHLENFKYIVDASKPEAAAGTNDRPVKRTNGDLFLADIQHLTGATILNAQIDIGRQDKMNNLPALADQLLQYTQAIFHGPQVAWSGTNFSISGDAKLAIYNKAFLYNIPAFDIALADGEVIYLEVNRNAVIAENGTVSKVARGSVPEGSTDTLVFILADRNGTKVQGPFAGEMEPGQVSDIGDKIGQAYQSFTGMNGENDDNPDFTNPLLVGQNSLLAGINALAGSMTAGGITQLKWISTLNGNDLTGTGSFAAPYKTLKKAYQSVTDATGAKRYAFIIGPGTYEEDNDIVTKAWIDLYAFTRDSVLLKRKDTVPGFVPFEFNFTGGSRNEFLNIQFGSGLTILHDALDPSGINLDMKFCRVTGNFIFNGLGGGLDFLFARECEFFNNATIHSVAFSSYMSLYYGILELDDDGIEAVDGFGSAATIIIQSSFINQLLVQSDTFDIYAQVYGSRIETSAFVDDQGSAVPPTLVLDSISHPTLPASLTKSGNAVIEKSTDVYSLKYAPTTPTDWNPAPTNGKEALDQLATLSRYFAQFKISAHEIDAEKARISAADITLLDGRILSQELRNLIIKFDGAVLDFSTGSIFEQDGSTPLGLNFTPFAIPVGQYAWYGIGIVPAIVSADNTISVQVLVTPPSAANAVEALAPKPVLAGVKKLGGVLIFNNAGSVELFKIRQLGTGSGSGGSGVGDLTAIQEELREALRESAYSWLTEIDFRIDNEDFYESGAAEFDVANQVYNFPLISDDLTTVDLFNADFLASENDSVKVEVHAFQDSLTPDTAFTLQATQDGAVFEAVPMLRVANSNHWVGEKSLTPTYTTQHQYDVANADTVQKFTNTVSRIAIPIVVTAKQAAKDLTSYLNKVGSPEGRIGLTLCKNNAGQPGEIIGSSSEVDIATLGAGNISQVFTVGKTLLIPGTYWLVLSVSDTYLASYSLGVHELGLRKDSSAHTYLGGDISEYNGAWATVAGSAGTFLLSGFIYELKLKYTAGTADVNLVGLGILFEEEGVLSESGDDLFQSFYVNGDDNQTIFPLSWFPDPKKLKIYDAQSLQVYTWPLFTVSGNNVVFPDGFFTVLGKKFFLHFDQMTGSGFDNSDQNATLLSENHLGSENPTIDRSTAGRGIILRNSAGVLKEIWLDEFNNLNVTDPQ